MSQKTCISVSSASRPSGVWEPPRDLKAGAKLGLPSTVDPFTLVCLFEELYPGPSGPSNVSRVSEPIFRVRTLRVTLAEGARTKLPSCGQQCYIWNSEFRLGGGKGLQGRGRGPWRTRGGAAISRSRFAHLRQNGAAPGCPPTTRVGRRPRPGAEAEAGEGQRVSSDPPLCASPRLTPRITLSLIHI